METFKDTKEAVRRRRADNSMVKRKRTKGQTMICKTLHRKLKIEEHEPNYKQTMIYKTLHRKQKIELHEPNYKQTMIYKTLHRKLKIE